jgi:DNA-binding CsgD family transcriptional regulator/DNA-binding transcriptional ArsR family regulator
MVIHTQVSSSFVGRLDELATLISRRSTAARGHGSVVLIEGEAGIGKTRLINAFCERLGNGRALLGVGICGEFGTAPYAPIADALHGAGCAPAAPTASSRVKELIELRTRLEAVCRRRNTVLVLEDIQWADEGTLAFLNYLLAYVGTMRLLVLATYRGDEISNSLIVPYVNRLASDRATLRIGLSPLSPVQIRSLLRLSLGERVLSNPHLEEIVARSDGNPFLAEELLTNALESNGSPCAAGLPTTIHAAVMERMAKLDEAVVEIATRAAVFGQRFQGEFLSTTFGYSERAIAVALRRLRDLNLIVELSKRPATYAFRHALTREAIYNSLLAGEVQPVHARILEALEAGGAANAQDLGYHAWAALDSAKCRHYNELAGDHADAVHAYADAVRCYELALQGDCDAPTRGRILLKAAVSASRDGLAERATQLYGAAASALLGLDTPQRLAEIYYAMGSQARLAGDNRRALSIIERAASDLPPDETRARAMLQVTSAFMRLDRGEVDQAKALIAQAEAASDLPIYHNAVAYAALYSGDVAALRSATAQHVRASARLSRDHLLLARFNLAFDLCILGLDAEAIAEFESIMPELDEAHLSSLLVLSYANAAIIQTRAGRFHLARELVERGLAIPEPTTTAPIALAAAGISAGHALGDDDLVQRCAPERIVEAAFASNINSTLGRLAGPYARWLHGQGDTTQAAAVLSRALAAIAAALGATETFLAAAEFGSRQTREAAYGFIPHLDALSHLQLYAATASHLRAYQSVALGRTAASRAHATQAAHCYRDLGWALHEARALELADDRDRCAAQYTAMEATADLRRIDPLSTREREVAALVANGSANNRIAKTLAVSQRTIEKHLTSIYAKLGLRNRAELAAFVARDSPHQRR